MSDLTLEEQQSAIRAKQVAENAVPLANIVELAASVIINVAGKDIADTLGNQTLNRAVLSNLISNRIKETILAKE